MAQMNPNYGHMTSQTNPIITSTLVNKYGYENVVWPIVLFNVGGIRYLYERNELCDINDVNDNRPQSLANISSHYIDYTSNPRVIVPADPALNPLIDNKYQCSYEYVCTAPGATFNSVDIDYAWKVENNWKAIETTTVWMPLSNIDAAKRLVGFFNRRQSWRGPKGPHGIRRQIDAAADLNLDYYMVVVNSIDKVSNQFNTNGNVFWFPLNHNNIDNILHLQTPSNAQFGTFQQFLNWL